MVVRCCERAARSGARQVVVASDDAEILQAVARAGFAGVLTRSDHATGTDRLAEAAQHLQLPPDEIVVNLQGDEPLIDPALTRTGKRNGEYFWEVQENRPGFPKTIPRRYIHAAAPTLMRGGSHWRVPLNKQNVDRSRTQEFNRRSA